MSTLMSTDMNVSRPSTRVHAPPGGATTISFGDPSTTTVKTTPVVPVAVVAEVVKEEVAVKLNKTEILSLTSSSKKVGIALATSTGAEEITSSIAISLAAKGITNVVVFLVQDPIILPYVAKRMAEDCAVVLAIGVVRNDNSNLSQTLTQALVETGLVQSCPIISAIISPSSLLELKASMDSCTSGWTSSVASLLALGEATPVALTVPEVVIEAAAVVETEVVTDVNTAAGARIGASSGQARPSTASSVNNSRRAPGGVATIVLG